MTISRSNAANRKAMRSAYGANARNCKRSHDQCRSEARKYFCYACLRRPEPGYEWDRGSAQIFDPRRCHPTASLFSFVVVGVNIACAPNHALDVEDADVEKHRKTTNRGQVLRALRGHSRAGVVHFVEVQSSLLRPWPLAALSE